MAKFSRLDVLNAVVSVGLVPVFYSPDVEVAKRVVKAIAAGGCRLFEFTNRGDFAPEVFKELSMYCHQELPEVILGVGSVVDEPTAALYVAYGANFVVGPVLNDSVARSATGARSPTCPAAAARRRSLTPRSSGSRS